MYGRLVSYLETSPFKRRLYLSVWCTSLSRVMQEMSKYPSLYNAFCVLKQKHLIYLFVYSKLSDGVKLALSHTYFRCLRNIRLCFFSCFIYLTLTKVEMLFLIALVRIVIVSD